MSVLTSRDQVLVSTEWLADRLDGPGIRIVDCRYSFERDMREDYLEGHIPGAVYFDFTAGLNDPNSDVDFMLAPPEQVAAAIGALGVDDDTLIVAYDHEGGHYASRVWLALARYGRADAIRILDGGWTKWVAEGRPISRDVPAPEPRTFTLNLDNARPEIIATIEDVRRASEAGDTVLLDVRRLSEFTGEEVRAKRGGRVPGAVHMLWSDNLRWEADRSFLPDAEIRRRHEEAGIVPDTPIIAYCQGGVRAAHAAIALWNAGYRDVRVYDGSWAEWGNRDDVPIETGPPGERDRS